MNNNNFGKKLKELRKSMGFTQEVLSEKAGIDEKHLSRIENGKYFPTYSTLNKILTALNLKIEDVGLELDTIELKKNPLFVKSLQILNSAKNDRELECYFNSLKVTQKTINILKN